MVAGVFSVHEYMHGISPFRPELLKALGFIFFPIFIFENFVPESMNDQLLAVVLGTSFGKLVTEALLAGSGAHSLAEG
jgi:hypothetical protein